MHWYKFRINDGTERGYTYVGNSFDAVELILEKMARGEFIRLNHLLYLDRGEIKNWSDWDNREEATVYINPASIVAIHPFKGDPRTLPR